MNARFVCATSSDLEGGVAESTFSRNCWDVSRIIACICCRSASARRTSPDLRVFTGEIRPRFWTPGPHLSANMLEAFQQWKWPGNVRELENWIARIVIFGAEEVIDLEFSRQLAVVEQPAPRYARGAHTRFVPSKALRRHR